MRRIFFLLLVTSFVLSGCEAGEKNLTPQMKTNARNAVIEYLNKNNLPIENLSDFKADTKPKSDFAFLYTGGGRCIAFAVECYNSLCSKVSKYPYDEHGDDCP